MNQDKVHLYKHHFRDNLELNSIKSMHVQMLNADCFTFISKSDEMRHSFNLEAAITFYHYASTFCNYMNEFTCMQV